MRVGARGWSLAVCLVSMSAGAVASNFSASLKNYYAQFEIVVACEESAASDVYKRQAMDKIESYYLKKDASIDKDHLLDLAEADRDEGFRIMGRSGGGLRPYCRQSLRDLLMKAEEIAPVASEH